MGIIGCEVLRTSFLNCRLDTLSVTGRTCAFKWKRMCNGVLHLGFHYVGMLHKKVFNLFREDFVSNPDDDVLNPSYYSSVSILLQHELVPVCKQRNTAQMTAVVGKRHIGRSLVRKSVEGRKFDSDRCLTYT